MKPQANPEDKKIIIDTKSALIVSDSSISGDDNINSQSQLSPSLSPNEYGKLYSQGRWTQYEHLIFLA